MLVLLNGSAASHNCQEGTFALFRDGRHNREVPRVSEAHVAARRQQILDAARICFTRNGFHQTSMQDVIKQANLSVGAVYRYFPSKTELIAALAGTVIDQIAGTFAGMATEDPPPTLATAMQRAVDIASEHTGPDGLLRLALQIWAEAQRDPSLAAFVESVYLRIRESIIMLAKRAQATGELPADVDPVAIGSVLFALMPGYAMQRILIGVPDPEVFKEGIGVLLGRARP